MQGFGDGAERTSSYVPAEDEIRRSILVSPALFKIRPDFGVFLIADTVHLFQIVGASEWPRGNDSRSHNFPNARNHFQFLFRRGVDVDPARVDFFFCMRLCNLDRTDNG